MRMQRLNSYLIRVLLILGSLVAMLPIYMAVVNSFKTQGEMFQSFLALPTTLHWENYSDAFNKINLLGSSMNSAIVSFLGIGELSSVPHLRDTSCHVPQAV